jgi:hypothetical protein
MSTSNQTYLGASQNLVSSCSGAVQPLLSSIASFPPGVADPAAAGTWSLIQSGQILRVPALALAGTVNLPPVATSAGHTFTVVCGATLGFTLTITAQSACIRGYFLQPATIGDEVKAMNSYNSATANNSPAGTGCTSIVLAATCVVGDRVELKCDGVSWFVQGWSGVASGTQNANFN